MEKKKWWKSRTIWTNIFAMVALLSLQQFGFEITPEETGGFLVVVNVILRAITKSGLE